MKRDTVIQHHRGIPDMLLLIANNKLLVHCTLISGLLHLVQ